MKPIALFLAFSLSLSDITWYGFCCALSKSMASIAIWMASMILKVYSGKSKRISSKQIETMARRKHPNSEKRREQAALYNDLMYATGTCADCGWKVRLDAKECPRCGAE